MQGFYDCLGGVVLSLDPNTHPRHALHQGQNAGLTLVLLADDRIDLPMAKMSAFNVLFLWIVSLISALQKSLTDKSFIL